MAAIGSTAGLPTLEEPELEAVDGSAASSLAATGGQGARGNDSREEPTLWVDRYGILTS